MIEKKFVAEKIKEFEVGGFIAKQIGKGNYTFFEIKKTPLGEKIVIHTGRPGVVVGKKGENIRTLTMVLKNKFSMDNPQIEVIEVMKPELDAQSMAEQIVNTLERFGPKRFKSTGYQSLQKIMDAGALGAEIIIGGRGVPSTRAKSWRFYNGYLKKCGDVAVSQVGRGFCVANLRSGSIGVKVRIMPPTVDLPDKISIIKPKEPATQQEAVPPKEEEKKEQAQAKTKKTRAKRGEGQQEPKKRKTPSTKKKATPKKEEQAKKGGEAE